MSVDVVDLVIISVIFTIVFYYAFIRYREEKKKQKEQLIPTLELFREKFLKEREDYANRAKSYEEKLNQIKKNLEELKSKKDLFPWTDSQIDYLKSMKGSEFEYFLNTTFEMLGFKVLDPEYYKEYNIDSILLLEDEGKEEYIMVDYLDFSQIGRLNENYLRELDKGKQKYGIEKVWIITNTDIKEEKLKKIYQFDFNLLDINYLTRFLPSLNFFYEYQELRNKFHATEILRKEMFDEIIRRNHWLEEVEQKILEAIANENKLRYRKGG